MSTDEKRILSDEPPLVLPVRDGYDLWSAIYDEEDNPLIERENREIDSLLGSPAGREILDLGCGTGRWAIPLARRGGRVTALDFSTRMLARARSKPDGDKVRFLQHDLSLQLPLESSSFDRVLLCLVLEHVTDLRSLFREVYRVLAPGGFAITTNLHPAMNLLGIEARFGDPSTGREVRPRSIRHSISDYILAALESGFVPDSLGEHVVDEELAARSPRSRKYLGWPLLFVMRLRPVETRR